MNTKPREEKNKVEKSALEPKVEMNSFQYVDQLIYSIKCVEETILKVTSLFQYGLIFWK